MPQKTVYIRDEDLEKWNAVKKKSEFIHEALNAEQRAKDLLKGFPKDFNPDNYHDPVTHENHPVKPDPPVDTTGVNPFTLKKVKPKKVDPDMELINQLNRKELDGFLCKHNKTPGNCPYKGCINNRRKK